MELRKKSYECFLDELRRCELLGIERHNFQYCTLLFELMVVQGLRRINRMGYGILQIVLIKPIQRRTV